MVVWTDKEVAEYCTGEDFQPHTGQVDNAVGLQNRSELPCVSYCLCRCCGWVLQRWSFPATLYWKWRHRDVERPLRSNESRSVRGGGAGIWVNARGSTLPGMLYGRAGRRQQTLLRKVRVSAARQWPNLRQRQLMLYQHENVSGSGLYVRQRWAHFIFNFTFFFFD